MKPLRKFGTVGVTSASGIDPAGALAARTSFSWAFDNWGLLSRGIDLPSYLLTTIHSMSIHICTDSSQAQSWTRCVYP